MDELNGFKYQEEIECLRAQFGFDFVGVALVQSAERHFELKWKFVTGNQSERYRRIVLQTGKGVAGHVFKTGKPFLVEDVEETLEERNLYNYPIVVSEGLKSFGAIPLYKYNWVKGVLLVGYRDGKKLSSQEFENFKEVIGSNFGPFYNREKVKD
ncbi:GAF domain-containing protein [Sporosarcina beigongshangi]|uniref:GAF domain-containing protein n=1 Tax=Sporosarcina beigongshangi TaxID=2782538 RepID=UPI00193A24B7|nr:GAF domain-containing protein [Sporosarcina beigongshangi]